MDTSTWPSALFKVRHATEATKFEGHIWLVGGAVRDALLTHSIGHDVDLLTDIDALELAQFLFEHGLSSMEPVTYPRFGTALVIVDGSHLEIATARRERYDLHSRKPHVEAATVGEDAARRDFTVNALMQAIHTGDLIDPTGRGLDDLNAHILCTPLDPRETLHEDPLRMLRAVRFKWQLGFEFADGLADAIQMESFRLGIISAERIRDELNRMLALEDADRAMAELLRLGLLSQFAPELVAMDGVLQGGYHHLDVWNHTLEAVRHSDRNDLVLRLAALFHDVGKPRTRTVEASGRVRFLRHELVGTAMTEEVLRRLRYPSSIVKSVCILVRNHMRLCSVQELSPAAARRLVRDLGDQTDRLIDLMETDGLAQRPDAPKLNVAQFREVIHAVRSETPTASFSSPLSGEQLMEILGIAAGPEIGVWKQRLLDAVLDGELDRTDETAAREWVLRRLADHGKLSDPSTKEG